MERCKDFGKVLLEAGRNVKEGEKLMLVGHSLAIQCMFGTQFDERKYVKDGIKLKNCEIREHFYA